MTKTCLGCGYCKPTIHRDRLLRRCRKHEGVITYNICPSFFPRFLALRRRPKKPSATSLQAVFQF